MVALARARAHRSVVAAAAAAAAGFLLAALPVAAQTVAAGVSPAAPAADMSAEARAYLAAALDSLQQRSMHAATADWKLVRDSAFLLAAGAQQPKETYGAINWALRRVDRHSYLQASRGQVNPELVDGRFGYLRVPFYMGPAQAPLADSLQSALRMLEGQGACGWIVDLRLNGGGNVWPMQTGIAPLAGDSVLSVKLQAGRLVGRTVYVDGATFAERQGTRTEVTRVERPYVMRRPDAPVAVLIDGATGSSAEEIAIIFKPRPHTRFFGQPTVGLSTVNTNVSLPDGASMIVTIDVMRDRTGKAYGGPIEPDETIVMPEHYWPHAKDAVVRRAAAWLGTQGACRR